MPLPLIATAAAIAARLAAKKATQEIAKQSAKKYAKRVVEKRAVSNRGTETVLTNPRTVLRTARKTATKTKKVSDKDAILVTLKTMGKSPIKRHRQVPALGGKQGLTPEESKQLQTLREVKVTKKQPEPIVRPTRKKFIVKNNKKMKPGKDATDDIFPEEDIPKVNKFDGVPQGRPSQKTIEERIEAGGEPRPIPSTSKVRPAKYEKELEDRAEEGIKRQESPSSPKPKKNAKHDLKLTQAQKEDALLRRLIMNKIKKRKPEARLTASERRELRLLRKVKFKKRTRIIESITKPKNDFAVSRYKAYQQPDLKKPLPPKYSKRK